MREVLGLSRRSRRADAGKPHARYVAPLAVCSGALSATLRAASDPTFPLRRALLKPNVQHRPAITDEVQLGALMVSIDEFDGWPTIRSALQLLALTMTRPGEIRFMRRSKEIIWPNATWRIHHRADEDAASS